MLSENIRKYRKANQMSQDELADQLNVTRQSISLWETGQTQPSLDNIVALAKVFHISTDALLTGEEAAPVMVNTAPPTSEKTRKKDKAVLVFVIILIVALVAVLVALLVLGLGGSDDQQKESVSASDPVTTGTESTDSLISGTQNEKDLYEYLKAFVIENGELNGDYCYYSKSADHYGGYSSEDFSLYYWGDSDTVEFCLHSVQNETFSINFYLYIPKSHTGTYEYCSSYYYRDTGESLYQAEGTIEAEKFTREYPLTCTDYFGSTDAQNDFMEMSRVGICDLLTCLEKFIEVEKLEYSFADFGFVNF